MELPRGSGFEDSRFLAREETISLSRGGAREGPRDGSAKGWMSRAWGKFCFSFLWLSAKRDRVEAPEMEWIMERPRGMKIRERYLGGGGWDQYEVARQRASGDLGPGRQGAATRTGKNFTPATPRGFHHRGPSSATPKFHPMGLSPYTYVRPTHDGFSALPLFPFRSFSLSRNFERNIDHPLELRSIQFSTPLPLSANTMSNLLHMHNWRGLDPSRPHHTNSQLYIQPQNRQALSNRISRIRG